jgi:DNA processing protein
MLNVAGGAATLARLASEPVVALLGSQRPSDYGRAMARGLARGLSASGVTVVSGHTDGIAAAAQTGAREAGGGWIAVLGAGLGVGATGRRAREHARLRPGACAVSELPYDCPARRWGHAAAERTIVGLARLAVLVEANENVRELASARSARELGKPLAALPGRVTSPLSSGPHALLLEGASPVRDAADILELLFRNSPPQARRAAPDSSRGLELEPRLRAILDLVGSGADTPDRLVAAGAEPDELLLALTELELRGLLTRGENGRYLPRHASLRVPAAGYQPLHGGSVDHHTTRRA